MVPSQVLIDDKDLERKPDFAVKVASNEENGSVCADPDEKGMSCVNNCEDTTFYVDNSLDEQTKAPDETEDVEVDIVDCTNINDTRLVEGEDPNATEYSSSFASSGAEDDSRLSNMEVQSQFCVDNGSMSIFDGFDSVFRTRKKKVTAHWRRFIRPLMWRCKWIELRIKGFQSQALKYDREIAAYDQRKELDLGKFTLEGFGAKSLPFYGQNQRKKALKRRRRKRVEDTVDIPSYMANHCLFSYYENKKRPDANGASVDDDCGNQGIAADQIINHNDEFGVDDEWLSLGFRDGDNSLEHILWKIEAVQSRAHKLKSRFDNVMCKYSGKFSSMENLSLLIPSDTLTTSAQSPTSSPGNRQVLGRSLYAQAGHVSGYDIRDMVMPESAVSSNGEATPLPNIIESTMGLLSAHASLDQPPFADSCGHIMDDVLIHNQALEEELQKFQEVSVQRMEEKPREPVKTEKEESEEGLIPPLVPAPEREPVLKDVLPSERSPLALCLSSKVDDVPKNKRKRGKRTRSGHWKRRSSGELNKQ